MPLPPSVGYGADFNQVRACFKATCRTARTEQNAHLSLRIRFLLALSAGTPVSAQPRCRPAASRPSADCSAVLSKPQASPVGPVGAEPVSSICCPVFSMTIIMPADVRTRGGYSQRGTGYQSPIKPRSYHRDQWRRNVRGVVALTAPDLRLQVPGVLARSPFQLWRLPAWHRDAHRRLARG